MTAVVFAPAKARTVRKRRLISNTLKIGEPYRCIDVAITENATAYHWSISSIHNRSTSVFELILKLRSIFANEVAPPQKILKINLWGLLTSSKSDAYRYLNLCPADVRRILWHTNNKKLRYLRDSARCMKRPFTVTHGHPLSCQSTRHIQYDFLLELDSNYFQPFLRYYT